MRSLLLGLAAMSALACATLPASAAQGTTTTDLPLRAAPASNTELLLTMPAGARVGVGACSGGWCRVTWNSYSGYAPKSGLVIAASVVRGPVRGVRSGPGGEIWPIFPPYPYRSGYYPKADWYHDMPPYVAIEPSYYRKRYFMIAQEKNRYRYMPHIFRGRSADYDIDYSPDTSMYDTSPSMKDASPSTSDDKPKQ